MCQSEGVCAPFGRRVGECAFSRMYICIGYNTANIWGICVSWSRFGEYAFPKNPASEGSTDTIQLTNILNCLQNGSNINLSIN